MAKIRPISDLRNNFTEISRIVHEIGEPVYLTKNGYGDMVVMSMELFDALQNNRRVDIALLEAERQALSGTPTLDFNETSSALRQKLAAKINNHA